jgi:hypothetical protein
LSRRALRVGVAFSTKPAPQRRSLHEDLQSFVQ